MRGSKVVVLHVKEDDDREEIRSRTARIFVNGAELTGITSYRIDAGMDYGRGGVVQKMTIEFYADVTIEHEYLEAQK